MKYRPEIDGLRAIAVTSVLLFHFNFSFFKGGFLGVDIFFVISGYLITTIIIRDLEKDQFSIKKFYERRARRILPALITVVLFCFPFAWYLYSPGELVDFGESVIATSLFVSNFLFYFESNYYDIVSEYKPLLHTWSLAVEEQYYIFFPIFLILFWRYGKKLVFSIIAIVFVVSIVLAEYFTNTVTTGASFYLLPTRVFEILLGSMITFVPANFRLSRLGVSNQLVSLVGLFLIIFGLTVLDSDSALPGALTLIPIIGTALVILFATQETVVNRILSIKSFVFLGLISYSTYLWHQPILAFSKYHFGELSVAFKIFLIFLIHILAYLNWRFIEKPFRNKHKLSQKRVFQLSLAVLALFFSLGFTLKKNNGFENRSMVKKLSIAQYESDNSVLSKRHLALLKEKTKNQNYQVVGTNNDLDSWFNKKEHRENVLIVGNSHSVDLYNVLTYSEYAKSKYDIARYGMQIRDIDDSFFKSNIYQEADIVIICSLLSSADVVRLDNDLIQRFEKDGKEIGIAKNLFLFPNYGNRTFADFIIKKELSRGNRNIKEIKHEVNTEHYNYFMTNKDKYQHNRINIDYILPLQKKHSNIVFLDRNDYRYSEKYSTYYAVDDSLNKFAFDFSHHSLKGAEFYGKMIDSINWLNPIEEKSLNRVEFAGAP